MKKLRYILPISLAIVIGLYLGKLVYTNYENNKRYIETFKTDSDVYFLQQGVYTTKESMTENASNLSDYIYALDDDKYRVFIGISSNQDTAKKIKNIYTDKGIDIYIKKDTISDNSFVEKLKEYDKMIDNTTDNNEILNYENQIMKEYELSYSEK